MRALVVLCALLGVVASAAVRGPGGGLSGVHSGGSASTPGPGASSPGPGASTPGPGASSPGPGAGPAPATLVVSYKKVVRVPRGIHLPLVITVRKLPSVPHMIKIKKAPSSTGWSGRSFGGYLGGFGNSGGYPRGWW